MVASGKNCRPFLEMFFDGAQRSGELYGFWPKGRSSLARVSEIQWHALRRSLSLPAQ